MELVLHVVDLKVTKLHSASLSAQLQEVRSTFPLWQYAMWPTVHVCDTSQFTILVQHCRKSSHWLHHFPFLAIHNMASSLCLQDLRSPVSCAMLQEE